MSKHLDDHFSECKKDLIDDHIFKDENAYNVTARSQTRFSKLALILVYLVIWAIAIVFFWVFTAKDSGDAMGYSFMFLWVILPVSTFIVSFLISKNDYWGKRKWLIPIGFGVMYMLAEYATFSMANNVAFNKVNTPEFPMIIVGADISLAAMGIGHLIYIKRQH